VQIEVVACVLEETRIRSVRLQRPPCEAVDYIRREVVTVGQQTRSFSRAVGETPHSPKITIFKVGLATACCKIMYQNILK